MTRILLGARAPDERAVPPQHAWMVPASRLGRIGGSQGMVGPG